MIVLSHFMEVLNKTFCLSKLNVSYLYRTKTRICTVKHAYVSTYSRVADNFLRAKAGDVRLGNLIETRKSQS